MSDQRDAYEWIQEVLADDHVADLRVAVKNGTGCLVYRDTLRALLHVADQTVAAHESKTICAWCGVGLPRQDIVSHVMKCERSPVQQALLAAAEARVVELEAKEPAP